MADTRKYLANASGSPPSQPAAPSEGFPQTAVPGETEATVPGDYWYYQVAEELRNAIIAGGLTPDHALVDQLKTTLEKLFGRTNGGDPNGVLAAKRLHERCWDTSGETPVPFIAITADGTVVGTKWVPLLALSDTALAGFRNAIINGDFRINQRDVATGAALSLADGEYFFDRWRSVGATSGIAVATDGTVTLGASEGIEQVIEGRGSDSVGFAATGDKVTISVADPSADLTVTLLDYSETDSSNGTISSGSGRRSVTLMVPSLDTDGHLVVRIEDASGGGATFSRVQVEHGTVATPFERRPLEPEITMASRYYWKFAPADDQYFSAGYLNANDEMRAGYVFPVTMRSPPTVTFSAFGDFEITREGGGGLVTGANTIVASEHGAGIYLTTNAPGAAGGIPALVHGANAAAFIEHDAEL